MNRSRIAIVLLLAGVGAACSSSQPISPPVPVEPAKKSDLSVLVGKWGGEYSSKDTGRTGSIVFELKSGGETTAHGDVLMWPKGSKAPMQAPASGELSEEQLRTMPQVLNIDFVGSSGGKIKGQMVPYMDPDCQCDVQTTFTGTVQGDTISGTYSTEPVDLHGPGKPSMGIWKVTRQKA